VAEYIEVMKQKRRMCNYYALCIMGCPLNDIDFCNKNSGEKTNADFPEVERRVMSWAAEHPEPVYPSIAKYLEQFGITIRRDGSLEADFFRANEPMSADIAQKLGIEPKEG